MDENVSVVVIIFLVLIILIILGINVGFIFNGITDYFIDVIKLLGFSTGSAINATADVVGDASKAGIDIVEDSVKDFGNLLKNTPPPPPEVQPVKTKENLDNGNFEMSSCESIFSKKTYANINSPDTIIIR